MEREEKKNANEKTVTFLAMNDILFGPTQEGLAIFKHAFIDSMLELCANKMIVVV